MVWRLPSTEVMGLVWTLKPAQRGQASRTQDPVGLKERTRPCRGQPPALHWEGASRMVSRGKGSGGTYAIPPGQTFLSLQSLMFLEHLL